MARNGRNQALRIPREFEPAAGEVVIQRDKGRFVVESVERAPALAERGSPPARAGRGAQDDASGAGYSRCVTMRR